MDHATPSSSTAWGLSRRLSKAAISGTGISACSLAMKPWSWLTLVIGMIPGMIGTVTPAARAAATKSKYARLSKKSWVIRYDAPRSTFSLVQRSSSAREADSRWVSG